MTHDSGHAHTGVLRGRAYKVTQWACKRGKTQSNQTKSRYGDRLMSDSNWYRRQRQSMRESIDWARHETQWVRPDDRPPCPDCAAWEAEVKRYKWLAWVLAWDAYMREKKGRVLPRK